MAEVRLGEGFREEGGGVMEKLGCRGGGRGGRHGGSSCFSGGGGRGRGFEYEFMGRRHGTVEEKESGKFGSVSIWS